MDFLSERRMATPTKSSGATLGFSLVLSEIEGTAASQLGEIGHRLLSTVTHVR